MSIEDAILEHVLGLPAAKKTEVLQFVSKLAADIKQPFRSPKGILADLDFTLTDEDLAVARREM